MGGDRPERVGDEKSYEIIELYAAIDAEMLPISACPPAMTSKSNSASSIGQPCRLDPGRPLIAERRQDGKEIAIPCNVKARSKRQAKTDRSAMVKCPFLFQPCRGVECHRRNPRCRVCRVSSPCRTGTRSRAPV